jgi:hypothetical protein
MSAGFSTPGSTGSAGVRVAGGSAGAQLVQVVASACMATPWRVFACAPARQLAVRRTGGSWDFHRGGAPLHAPQPWLRFDRGAVFHWSERMYKNLVIRTTGLALASLFVAAAANAAEAQTPTPTDTSVTVQGVQVAIDPATGRLVAPTAAQREALSRAMLQRAAQAPARPALGQPVVPRNEAEARTTFRTIQLKNGRQAVGMELPENLMSSLVAERRTDGSLRIHHAGDSRPANAPEVSQ